MSRRSRLRYRALLTGSLLAVGGVFALRLLYVVARDAAEGGGTVATRVFEEGTAVVAAAVLLPALLGALRAVPLVPGNWGRAVPAACVALGLFTVAHTTLAGLARAGLAPVLRLPGYQLQLTAARYTYEAAADIFPALVLFGGMALAEVLLAQRERERRSARLERLLLEAELQTLRLQMQPHFLFNALNTIAAAIPDDPRAAEAQVAQLAAVLRTSLRTTHRQEVSVGEEIALTRQYAALMLARFSDRLTVTVDAAPDTTALGMPSMLLQPLVENAIRHGGLPARGHGRVEVTTRRVRRPSPGERGGGAEPDTSAWLEVRVYDDGPGMAAGADPLQGTGLGATAKRVALLYGARAEWRAGNVPTGGFEVVVRMPAGRLAPGDDAAETEAAGGLPTRGLPGRGEHATPAARLA